MHAPLDSQLTLEPGPVKHDRGAGILHEVGGLAAVVVRVEDEPAAADSAIQHHAHRRASATRRRGECHRFGKGLAGFFRVAKPLPAEDERIPGIFGSHWPAILPYARIGFLHVQPQCRAPTRSPCTRFHSRNRRAGSRVRQTWKGHRHALPPEPNGRLHIGHAKAICIDFGVAQEFGGHCNLRFDDTNPVKESQEYVDEIERDIRWLGFDWGEHLYHASDYFEQLYQWAEQLIREGKAYVDSLTADQMREYRGTLTEPGRESPFRDRSVEENLDLFRRMRAGEFEDGTHVLRAKIDMSSGNMNMRDPVMYRIRKTPHQRTGDRWVIYPMYDWAHGQSDYIEGVTYSLCSLEYENHRPLYDWYLEALGLRPPRPRQIEFARLNLSYTVMSKRMLLELVDGGHVAGWDDPRMPTISGLRKRGYTPESIRNFCERIGVAKRNNVVDIANLEHAIREDLNLRAPRVMGVLKKQLPTC